MSSFHDDYRENALTPGRRLRRWWHRMDIEVQWLIFVIAVLVVLFGLLVWIGDSEAQACRDRGGEPVQLYRSMVCLAPGVVR